MQYYVFCFILWVLSSVIAHACEVTDDQGQKIHLSQPTKRIISLAPDLTEILFAVGADSQLVGVAKGSDYPAAAKNIPIVANYNTLAIESILKLHPDLIVAGSGEQIASQLLIIKQLGIPIFYSSQRDLADIPHTMRKLACLAGTESQGEKAAQAYENRYQALQRHYAHKKIISVFFEVWPRPLMTINKQSWINPLISLCRGRNIFAEARMSAPEVSIESVIHANPDAIIHTNNDKTWYTWPRLAAVAHQHVFYVNPDWVERAGPRLLIGAETICRQLDLARI